MTYQKQCIGIDISKDSFTACICKKDFNSEYYLSEVKLFKNEKKGYNQFLRWVGKVIEKEVEHVYLMEATGVYYENLAYHLCNLKKTAHVVLPNTSKHYFSS